MGGCACSICALHLVSGIGARMGQKMAAEVEKRWKYGNVIDFT